MKNKYEEALDFIIDHTHPMCETMKDLEAVDFSYNILQELVDKETPMKPNGLKCGKCGSWVMEDTRMGTTHFHRCRNIECEQKIDWNDNK